MRGDPGVRFDAHMPLPPLVPTSADEYARAERDLARPSEQISHLYKWPDCGCSNNTTQFYCTAKPEDCRARRQGIFTPAQEQTELSECFVKLLGPPGPQQQREADDAGDAAVWAPQSSFTQPLAVLSPPAVVAAPDAARSLREHVSGLLFNQGGPGALQVKIAALPLHVRNLVSEVRSQHTALLQLEGGAHELAIRAAAVEPMFQMHRSQNRVSCQSLAQDVWQDMAGTELPAHEFGKLTSHPPQYHFQLMVFNA